MIDADKDSAPSYRIVANWIAEFKDPIQASEDAPRCVIPPTTLTDGSIRAVAGAVTHDRQISVRQIADELAILETSLDEIVSDYLGMKKICMKWIPKLQSANLVDCSEKLLENGSQGPTGFSVTLCRTTKHGYIITIHSANRDKDLEENR